MVDTPYNLRNLPLIVGHAARQFDELGREVEDRRLIPGSGHIIPLEPGGPMLQDAYTQGRQVELWGMVWPTGPDGQADYTDERYWVRILFLNQTSSMSVDDSADFQLDALADWGGWLTVTNLAEKIHGSHTLQKATVDGDGNMTAAGRIVRCTAVAGKRDGGPTDYAFHQWVTDTGGIGALIPVSLTGDHTDAATYGGDATHAPTYTYKWPVNLLTGQEIKKVDGTRATGLTPTKAMRIVAKHDIGTHGEVYVDSSGNPVLWSVNEVPTSGERSCP